MLATQMQIKFPLVGDYQVASEAIDRIDGIHLEVGELATLSFEFDRMYWATLTVSATRASELTAELVREGWFD